MQTRREMLAQSAKVAGLLASAGLLPSTAQAAWSQAVFDAKTMADATKALGGSAPVSLLSLAQMLIEIAGQGSVRLVPWPEARKRIDIGDVYSSYARIQTVLGWQPTIDLRTGLPAKAQAERSDVTAVPAMGVIAEALTALVLADAMLEKFGGDSLTEMRRNYDGYLSRLAERWTELAQPVAEGDEA